MDLKKVLNGLEGLKAKGNLDIDIESITNNSKDVKKGSLYIAIKGFVEDGHKYINDAIKKGASVIVVEEDADIKDIKITENITLVVTKDTRYASAIIACNFYKDPSKRFKLIGITGTKGKTTTSFMIKTILEKSGKKVGVIGSIGIFLGDKELESSGVTTPDSIYLQKKFYEMAEEKVDIVVMEVSSQALMLDRVTGSDFDIGVFTNLSKDHISEKEHKNMNEYFNEKLKLFNMCKTAIINVDDLYGEKAKKAIKTPEILTYGIDNAADIVARDITITNAYVDFRVRIDKKNERIKTGIPGRFSVYNSLAAISVVQKIGTDVEEIKEALLDIKVLGRNELVPNKKDLVIMIDSAHTPDSLEKLLSAVKVYTRGRVISVFGCGGDRDPSKRIIMGEISGRVASYTIITSDNPRTEKPELIAKEIEKGIKKTNGKYKLVVDRRKAIEEAIQMANKKDIIVLAGKGHEMDQEIMGKTYPFDERKIVTEIIEKMTPKKIEEE